MSGKKYTVFCTPAFGLFGSIIDLGVDLAPARDRIQACKLRYHKELWNIICDQGIQGSDSGGGGGGDGGGGGGSGGGNGGGVRGGGGSSGGGNGGGGGGGIGGGGGSGEEQPAEEGDDENQSNARSRRFGTSASNSGAVCKGGSNARWRNRKSQGVQQCSSPVLAYSQTSSPNSATLAETLLTQQAQMMMQQGATSLRNRGPNQRSQQQSGYQPQAAGQQQQFIPQKIPPPGPPNAMQAQQLLYPEAQVQPPLHRLPHSKHPRPAKSRHKPQQLHQQFEPQSYAEKQKPHIQRQYYPPVNIQSNFLLQQQQRDFLSQQKSYLEPRSAYPMQRYCAENPFEAGTQQSHPVNPRLAYLSRRMSHLHDYNLSSTSSSSSSSCSSPHSTTAADESLKSEAGSAPARRHIGSHSFVPMKCGDWNKSATCIAKKKRHKNSGTER